MSAGTVHQLKPGRSRHETQPLAEATERLTEDANPREVAKHAQAMTIEMLECRRMRHRWESSDVDKIRGGWTETLTCRCGAYKQRRYNGWGHVVDYGKPNYPEGYLFTGLGRLGEAGRDVVIKQSLLASMEAAEARAKRGASYKSKR